MQNLICKYFTLIVVFFFSIFSVNAQTEYLVTVNPDNGVLTKIDSIPSIKWLQTTSAYDEVTKHYTFIGLLDPPDQSPEYFVTLDAITGNVLTNPILIAADKLICFKYSRLSGVLYGIFRDSSAVYRLASIDPVTGTNTSLTGTIPNLNAFFFMAVDDENEKIFLLGFGNFGGSTSYGLWTIDINSGNIDQQALPKFLSGPVYDSVTHKIYGLTNRPGPLPATSIWSITSVDIAAGSYTVIADIPGLPRMMSGFNETLDENNHLYFFKAAEQNDSTFLYTTDFITGSTVKVPVSSQALQGPDNLVFFRYDNQSGKLYALFWEAATILPVTLNKFDAILRQKSVLCSWQTFQEINSNQFEIERSADGINYLPIGKVTAASNSSILHNYSFIDYNPYFTNKEYLYYRLKMEDKDGNYDYSNISIVKLDYESSLNISPNPVNNELTLNYFSSSQVNVELLIIDLTGRIIRKQNASVKKGQNSFLIITSGLANGVYIMSIKKGNNYIKDKFIKVSR